MMSALYGVVLLAVLFVIVFMAYYAYRLVRTPRREEDLDSRLRAFLHAQSREATGQANGGAIRPLTEATAGKPAAAPAESRPGTRFDPAELGLRTVYPDPVFVRKDRSGEIVFQAGDRPSMPLKFLLEPKARTILQELCRRADLDFGPSWAVLAEEDEEGRLSLRRLG